MFFHHRGHPDAIVYELSKLAVYFPLTANFAQQRALKNCGSADLWQFAVKTISRNLAAQTIGRANTSRSQASFRKPICFHLCCSMFSGFVSPVLQFFAAPVHLPFWLSQLESES
jgi:hypothetical protein